MNVFDSMTRHFIGDKLANKVESVSVGIAGLGGLGSNIAQMLMRSGFTQLTLVDYDVVELYNLNRQFYFYNQIGSPKALALKQNLQSINAYASVNIIFSKISKENVQSMFRSCDIVVEALDNAQDKALMCSNYINSGKLFICFSGIAGYGINLSESVKIRKISKTAYIIGDGVTEVNESTPPLAPRVTQAAAKAADIILEYVASK